MWELDHKESWALENWCFWIVVLEKTLERSNQSILKEISPEYSLEGQMLKLKLQYFHHLMWRADFDAGKDWRWEEKGTTARSQREELRPWQRSWGRRLGIRKGRIERQETPCSWASTPKTRVLLYCFMLSSTPLTLRGALPHHLSRRGSYPTAPVNKNSWAWQECFDLRTPLKVT